MQQKINAPVVAVGQTRGGAAQDNSNSIKRVGSLYDMCVVPRGRGRLFGQGADARRLKVVELRVGF